MGVPDGSFRLGDWVVNPAVNRLRRGDRIIRLQPRAMDVLVCLAESCGELVTKQELIDRVWAVDVVAQGSLTGLISHLRSALGDDPGDPQYIETIHTRGYRLVPGTVVRALDEDPFGPHARSSGETPREANAAEKGLVRAIEAARADGSTCSELRSAMRLAILWRDQGKIDDAIALLRPIVDRCDDEETVPLLRAKALLWDLSADS